jgi:hypothetical protein
MASVRRGAALMKCFELAAKGHAPAESLRSVVRGEAATADSNRSEDSRDGMQRRRVSECAVTPLASDLAEEQAEPALRRVEGVPKKDPDDIGSGDIEPPRLHVFRTAFDALD